MTYGQYRYIVEKYIIYLYEFLKQVEKWVLRQTVLSYFATIAN